MNRFGSEETAAFNAALQLWNYVQMPALAIGAAVSAMAAQNVGAGRWDRVRRVAATGYCFNLRERRGADRRSLYLLDRPRSDLFLPAHGAAIDLAVHLNAIVLWSFLFFGMSMVLYGVVRATGAVCPRSSCSRLSLGAIRVPFAFSLLGRWHADAIWWSFPIASIASVTDGGPYYRFGGWRKVRMGIDPSAKPRPDMVRWRASARGPGPRPLVVRCGAFGDMVLLTALIRLLHARFSAPVDIVTSGPWSEPLLEGQPGVGEVLCVRSRKTPYWLAPDQRRVVRRLRARGARTDLVLRRQRCGAADARARRHCRDGASST